MIHDAKYLIKLTQSNFYENYRYSKERLEFDYQYEINKYSDDKWEAPQRAARLSAAVKNFKTSQMLCFVFDIAFKNELDLTPLVVKRLCKNLFGRTGSQSLIVEVFGNKERVHRSNDSSQKTIDELTKKYRLAAHNYWADTLTDIDKVKLGYRTKVRNIEKAKDK